MLHFSESPHTNPEINDLVGIEVTQSVQNWGGLIIEYFGIGYEFSRVRGKVSLAYLTYITHVLRFCSCRLSLGTNFKGLDPGIWLTKA